MSTKSFGRCAAAAALLALPACAGGNLGALGDILGGAMGTGGQQQGQIVAEVQSVDTRNQVIRVRTQQGETGDVRYDQNTTVLYQQQQYPVTALERGDVIEMQLQQVDKNRLYTSRIEVRQSVQERSGQSSSGATGQLRQISGRVAQVDHQRAFFELQTQQGTYTVLMPANAGPATRDYFSRLRTGDNVVIEGTLTGSGRIDLYRFI